MKKYISERQMCRLNRMSSSKAWLAFKKECEKAKLKKNSPLFKRIISEYKQLVDEELGVGSFKQFQTNQKRIEEYRNLLPKIEFYWDCGFLLPRTAEETESYEKKLHRKILKERLENEGAFELKKQVIDSNARERIRLKYGVLIDFMCPQEDVAEFALSIDGKRERYAKREKTMELFLRLIEAKMQNQEELLRVLQNGFPGLYGAFLLLFRDAMQWVCA